MLPLAQTNLSPLQPTTPHAGLQAEVGLAQAEAFPFFCKSVRKSS